jgi:hypothetical protein
MKANMHRPTQERTIITRRPKRLRVIESPRARRDDPETSKEAAAAVSSLRVWWAAVLDFYAEHDRGRGWNTYESTRHLDLGTCPWKRVSECKENGWLAVVLGLDGKPLKRPGETSRRQQCYRITELGLEVLEECL